MFLRSRNPLGLSLLLIPLEVEIEAQGRAPRGSLPRVVTSSQIGLFSCPGCTFHTHRTGQTFNFLSSSGATHSPEV